MWRGLAVVCLLSGLGCRSAPPHEAASAPPATAHASAATRPTAPPVAQPRATTVIDEPSDREKRGIVRLALLNRGAKVPAFRVQLAVGSAAADGSVPADTLDSASLIGAKPFVIVFFTSWCAVCARKMPIIRKALEVAGGGIVTLGVSLDEDETWAQVAPYVERHQLPFKIVRGETATAFTGALDPRGSFPIVYVVARDGAVAEVQLGLQPDHGARLQQALRAVSSR